MAIYKELLLLNKLWNSLSMYQNCISSNLAFCFIWGTHFWEKIIRTFGENYKNYMAVCKELLLLNKRIVWQVDQPETAVNNHKFV